ncbi:hypothetical protein [Spirosoma sp.]|uniref:hypothetical protein n=1 Tax=Spirosoma sp. TaxID=1899569 RepID=UPI00262E57DB|nr:hypothetical protein [Spirosoma sp.]MCX6213304.1 hypothetical protein [Spirosoma sp.]
MKNLSALAVLLVWVSFSLKAQHKLPDGSWTTMLEITSRIADVDSSLQIEHYSLTQRIALLKQLYQIDQRYRDSLENGSRSASKQQLFTHKMVANDQANQVLFRKLVDAFGWPTRQKYGEQGTQIAWLIVWHAKPEYQKRYYPLMKQAYQQGLIRQNPSQIGERLKRFYR